MAFDKAVLHGVSEGVGELLHGRLVVEDGGGREPALEELPAAASQGVEPPGDRGLEEAPEAGDLVEIVGRRKRVPVVAGGNVDVVMPLFRSS